MPLLFSSLTLMTALVFAGQTHDDEEDQQALQDHLTEFLHRQAALKDTRSIPDLIKSLADKAPDDRRQAALVLELRHEGVQDAVPSLIEALKDVDGEVRRQATFALATIGRSLEADAERDRVVTAILGLTEDRECAVRRAMIIALSYFTRSEMTRVASHQRIVKATIDALTDSQWSLRAAAASSIGEMSLPPRDALAPLLVCLKDNSRNVRCAAIRALQKYEAAAKPAVPA